MESVICFWCNDDIGTLKSSLHTGESFNVVVIFFLEVCLEIGHGVLCCGFVLLFVHGTVKNTSFDKHGECEMNGNGIGDGFPTGSGEDLAVMNAFPEVFDGFLGCPWCNEMLVVGIKIWGLIGPYMSIRCANMACRVTMA